ncbi:MAG: hypothetical protein K0Q55_866 [Verrucomicrobia bacterium]|jgi:hypothetical protein|nr:hypothetical protein [Verrucomicrobiota bacterium]
MSDETNNASAWLRFTMFAGFGLMVLRFLLLAWAVICLITFLVPGPCIWSGPWGLLYSAISLAGAYTCKAVASKLVS